MQGLIDTTIKHYRIQRRLARGGMSEVYLAEDTRTSQVVAVKVVPRNAEDFVERFRREVRTIASLQHDHILPALDYGDYDSWSYLVTPYIVDGTLRERLAKGSLSLKEAGRFLEQIADALHYAHGRGILHRDIKTSNVLLRSKDHAYLADFGLVKTISDEFSLTRSGFLVGTPEYMAPELVEHPATVQSDIYALGVVLYEMLTGTVPFKGHTPVAIVMRHLNEAPVPPSRLNALIPFAVENVILRALDKSLTRRFQSARDLAAAYRQALEEEAKTETVQVAALTNAPTIEGPVLDEVVPQDVTRLETQALVSDEETNASVPDVERRAAVPSPMLTSSPPPPMRAPGPRPPSAAVSPPHPPLRAPGPKPLSAAMEPSPPPLEPVRVSVRPAHLSPASAFLTPLPPPRPRTPQWMWLVWVACLVLLLVAGSLLISVFSALQR
jgi:serine/threonine protein kinase